MTMVVPSRRSGDPTRAPVEVGSVVLPTPYGEFHTKLFETTGGYVYLALIKGEISGAEAVLTRLHSECLTGDALGSLRCDCGVQLRTAMRATAAEDRGVVLYLTGHEGRGIGLVNKFRAYMEQRHCVKPGYTLPRWNRYPRHRMLGTCGISGQRLADSVTYARPVRR
jgi:hypothetical protein